MSWLCMYLCMCVCVCVFVCLHGLDRCAPCCTVQGITQCWECVPSSYSENTLTEPRDLNIISLILASTHSYTHTLIHSYTHTYTHAHSAAALFRRQLAWPWRIHSTVGTVKELQQLFHALWYIEWPAVLMTLCIRLFVYPQGVCVCVCVCVSI